MTSRPKQTEAFSREVAAARQQIVGLLDTRGPARAERTMATTPSLPDVRYAPHDPEAAEAELIKSIPHEVLRATGCFTLGDGDAPRLISGLRQPNSPVLLIVNDSDIVIEVVAEGRPPEAPCAAIACLHNMPTLRRIKDGLGVVIAAPDLHHVIEWAHLGLAAVPLDETLATGRAAARYWKLFSAMTVPISRTPDVLHINLKRDDMGENLGPERLPAVMVAADWDPLRCQRLEDKGAATLERLAWLSTIDPNQEVGSWAPSDQTLGHLRAALAAKNTEGVTSLLRYSLDMHLQRLTPPSDEPEAEVPLPRTLVELRREVSSSARRGLDPRLAMQAYLAQVEKEVVNPVLQAEPAADAADDQVIRFVVAGLLSRFAAIDIAGVRDQAADGAAPLHLSVGAELNKLAKLIHELECTRRGERNGSRRRRR